MPGGAGGEADGRKSTEEEMVEETAGATAEAEKNRKLKDRKVSWAKLRRIDSLNLEAGRVSMVAHNPLKLSWRTTLSLAFQSIGVVYGDIGTSPLYVFSSTFPNNIKNHDDILGVLSLIIYTIVLIPMTKYVFIVLWANDNGNGGAFALYSLICRHIKMSLIPNEQPEDRELSNYKLETPSSEVKRAHKVKQKLEGSPAARIVLLFLAIMGTSMVIGDGILTPSISGSEAMFADLGHFNVRSIQISFSCITFPAIVTAYVGQAAYLRKFPENVSNTFYDSIPHRLYWPTFVVAVAAAIIASQAMISGAFSIISQALSLGCFPRVRVVHTSVKHQGQVYIPEVNYMFMVACILVCVAFKTTEKISHAYGIAVIGDMMITTTLVSLIMLVLWKKSLWLVGLFFLGFGFVELVYFTSQLTKFTGGGYLPIVSAMFLTTVMGTWHYVHKERYMFELKNKVSSAYLNEVAKNPDVRRVPGIGLLYSELVQGIPPIFPHLIGSIPSIHSIVVFVSIKAIPVSRVALEERFLFRQVEPREYRIFRCVVRHGYNDLLEDLAEFESQLIQHLKAFVQEENYYTVEVEGSGGGSGGAGGGEQAPDAKEKKGRSGASSSTRIIPNQSASVSSDSIRSATNFLAPPIQGAEEELKFIDKALEKGVVYMIAEAEVVAHPNSSIFNKIFVNYFYSFFRKNFRQGQNSMAIPPNRLLKLTITLLEPKTQQKEKECLMKVTLPD
ncbi:unnamed protein product [Sphenostylis stenocarpa]|uniref:Potassium transporter n=1 Tax=Sphenostylis stenocarpa TaxID=92480 RepID=A0AA86T048_9FABA|nr:unnamed protein product [Sphenostylis stenocarpa]